MIERTTLKNEIGFDCVEMIALLKNKETKITYLILIANFRPPVNKFVLEFPGGIMDDGNLEENALRELKEETGYVGKISENSISPILFSDPWKSNESCKSLVVEIDEDENKNPK
jgi:ADP-ribose pyrophosphatase